jgi:hypothetical protein
MAEEVVATFSGPLDSFSVNLTLDNASASDVRAFGVSGRTAKFPVTWDTFGTYAGRPTLISTTGEDTEVVMVKFANFSPGLSVTFSGLDPDFTGDASSGVRILDLEGSRAIVFFADGTTGFGVFEPTDDATLRAVITK